MANITHGMDPEAVKSLAAQMIKAADQIEALAGQLSKQLANAAWVGPDATSFKNDWQSHHQSQLKAVSNAVRDAATRAQRNAEQQIQTSQG